MKFLSFYRTKKLLQRIILLLGKNYPGLRGRLQLAVMLYITLPHEFRMLFHETIYELESLEVRE